MLDAPEREDELTVEADPPHAEAPWWRGLHASSTTRALLLTALGGLLIAGLITAIPPGPDGKGPMGLGLGSGRSLLGARTNDTFEHAKSGDCLNWPERTPDAAQVVNCADEHRFEVAESIDMRTFPGSEYGPDAAPPSAARIQQISQEQCQAAARQHLGAKFDPNGKFTVSLLWSGDKAWRDSGERRMLCGLQLPGANNQQQAFKGKIADLDQSKVWPAGTCIGIDPVTSQPTDIPIDCAAPHAMEITGTVNLGERFPGPLPADADQDAFIKDSCTKMTDAYLAPIQLRSTTLTLFYSTIALPSWSAGSHQVSCNIGATLGNGGWSVLLNGAKGPLAINGQPPVPPPDIPQDRLELPPIPIPPPVVDTSTQAGQFQQNQQGQQTQAPAQPTGNQHLPGQATTSPTTSAPAGPPGNTFLNGPSPVAPPPPADGAPPGDIPPPLDGGLPPAGPPPGAPPPVIPPPGE
jgi:predicted heme/steroid binding protein